MHQAVDKNTNNFYKAGLIDNAQDRLFWRDKTCPART